MLRARGFAWPAAAQRFFHRVQHSRRARSSLLLLTLASLVLAIGACTLGAPSIRLTRGLPYTNRPASQLHLDIQIAAQYSDSASPGVSASFLEGTTVVLPPQQARISCSGSNASHVVNTILNCPRQPPGGAYRITYTDEHGASTTVVVPVPTGVFAFITPKEGSSAPIPLDNALTIRLTTPALGANDSITFSNISAWCGSPSASCGSVNAGTRIYTATPTGGAGLAPNAASGEISVSSLARKAAPADATAMPGKTPTRGPTPTAGPTFTPGFTPAPTTPPYAGATVTRSRGMDTILLTGDFSQFHPASGTVSLTMEMHVTPDPGAFAEVTVTYHISLQSHFTWTR